MISLKGGLVSKETIEEQRTLSKMMSVAKKFMKKFWFNFPA
jgi:hypothetical protein